MFQLGFPDFSYSHNIAKVSFFCYRPSFFDLNIRAGKHFERELLFL